MVLAPTKPGTKRLSEVARKVVEPSGIVSSGWASVRDTCSGKLGVQFDEWQHGTGRLILAKRADGKLASMIGGVGMSLPRQVGKTYLIGAMTFALCINQPGLLVIWSAHHARTHGETFLSMQAFADRQRVKPYVRQVFVGSGDEEIRFVNGSRILFGARERGFGRGVPGVDMIVSDEAQIMSDKALDAQLATMNTSQFGLAIYVGTPPRPDDPSEAFTRMRTDAWSGRLLDAAWIEVGAERGVDPNDRRNWYVNPSYPHRTPAESILRLQRKLKPDSFLREGLGVWDEEVEDSTFNPISAQGWKDAAKDVRPDGGPQFFITVAKGLRSASIFAAAKHDGVPHVAVAGYAPGVSWLTAKVKELHQRFPDAEFAAYSAGPVKSWVPTFAEFDVEPRLLTVPETNSAYACLAKAVEDRAFTHSPERVLSDSLDGAVWREVEGGSFNLDWKKSEGDPSLIAGVAGALWLLESKDDDVEVWGFFDD